MHYQLRASLEDCLPFTASSGQAFVRVPGVCEHRRHCSLTLADPGIQLKSRRLISGNQVIELPEDPCDALFPQNRESASLKPDSSSQPTQNEELIAQ